MRRLLLLVAVLVFVDTMLFAALTPLLPKFAHELGLSKTRSGVLVAAYGAGALAGGLPGGYAATRFGPRQAVLAGLAMMSAASVAFALADSFWPLLLARLAQGLGSAFTWSGALAWLIGAAPRERRGEMIGSALGAAVFGALFGPVLGVLAAAIGRSWVFCGLAVAGVVLTVLTLRVPAARAAEDTSVTAFARAFADSRFASGLALLALASLLVGILSVLGPLHLASLGWGATAIGMLWLGSAAIETFQSPWIGRVSDRRGAFVPVRAALVAGAVVSAGLATGAGAAVYAPLIILAELAYGALFTPSFALIADGAESVELAQGMAFGMMNSAWALGAIVGPAVGGALATATGDWIPFLLSTMLCAGSLAGARGLTRRGASSTIPGVR